jgi:chromate transporter
MEWKLILDIFILFTRVAMFSWGGGPASMALMQRETVQAGWVTPEQFADALAIGNALPGPIAIKVPAYIGYKIAGWGGTVAGVAGSSVIPALVMMLVVIFFFGVKDSPAVQAMLKAVRPVVVGFLLWTAYDLAISVFGVKKLGWGDALIQGWDKAAIALVAFGLMTFTSINPVFVVIAAAVFGFMVYR